MARVAIVSSYGPSLVRFRGDLVASLCADGHDVFAASPDPIEPAGLRELGATYVALPMERAGTSPVADLRSVAAMTRMLRRIRADVVLTYNVKPVVYGTLAARLARVPRRIALVTGLGYLFLPDGTRRQRVVSAIARPIYRAGLASATTVVVQNPDDERDLVQSGLLSPTQRVVRVAGSGVDLAGFPEVPVPGGPPRFLFVGRLLRDKGLRELVEAMRRVRETVPGATLDVVGGTDPNPSSVGEAEVRGWVAEGLLTWHGEVADVRPYLARCSVLVLPSYREGTPRSVLEAMATGRAAVTTDAPGCRETVVDGVNGWLVPVRDAASLATAMERFADPSLAPRMGAQGRRLAEERFDVRAVTASLRAAMGLDRMEPTRTPRG